MRKANTLDKVIAAVFSVEFIPEWLFILPLIANVLIFFCAHRQEYVIMSSWFFLTPKKGLILANLPL